MIFIVQQLKIIETWKRADRAIRQSHWAVYLILRKISLRSRWRIFDINVLIVKENILHWFHYMSCQSVSCTDDVTKIVKSNFSDDWQFCDLDVLLLLRSTDNSSNEFILDSLIENRWKKIERFYLSHIRRVYKSRLHSLISNKSVVHQEFLIRSRSFTITKVTMIIEIKIEKQKRELFEYSLLL